jgi:hypothetical protein
MWSERPILGSSGEMVYRIAIHTNRPDSDMIIRLEAALLTVVFYGPAVVGVFKLITQFT